MSHAIDNHDSSSGAPPHLPSCGFMGRNCKGECLDAAVGAPAAGTTLRILKDGRGIEWTVIDGWLCSRVPTGRWMFGRLGIDADRAHIAVELFGLTPTRASSLTDAVRELFAAKDEYAAWCAQSVIEWDDEKHEILTARITTAWVRLRALVEET